MLGIDEGEYLILKNIDTHNFNWFAKFDGNSLPDILNSLKSRDFIDYFEASINDVESLRLSNIKLTPYGRYRMSKFQADNQNDKYLMKV